MVRSFDDDTVKDFTEESGNYRINNEVFKINTALVVYESNKNATYMEKINFKKDGESMVAVGASPVRMKDVYAMREALDAIREVPTIEGEPMEKTNFKGMMPKNIIFWSRADYRKIIWTLSPGTVYIDMAYEDGEFEIPMDTILFATDGDNIKGFLLPKEKDFDEDDYLDALPLPNFYSSSNMCNGNTKLGSYNTMENYIQAWENRVFKTKYSNENLGVGGIDGLKKLSGKKRLPKKYRVQSRVSINDLIVWLT